MAINRGLNSRTGMRVKPWVVVAGAALIIAVVVAVILFTVSGSVESEALSFARSGVSVVIIRDERVVSMAAYGKINYQVDEGARVTKDMPVAEVSRMGYDDNVRQDLLNVQREIFQYQMNTKWEGVNDKAISEMQARVSAKYKEIAMALQRSQADKLLVLERELEELLTERNELLRTKTLTDAKLTEWYQREQQYLDQLAGWKEYVVADAEGKISFYIDNYAALLNAAMLERISLSDIQATYNNRTVDVLSDSDKRPVYRIVYPERWYVAIATSGRDNYHMGLGMKYTVELDGFYDSAFEGEVVIAKRDSGGSLYILQIDSDVTPVMDIRASKATLRGEFSGYTIPKKGVSFDDDGNASVTLSSGGGEVPIEILAEDENKYLFRSDNAAIHPGMHFEKPVLD